MFCHAPDISKIPIYFGKVVFFPHLFQKRRKMERDRKEGKMKRKGGGEERGKEGKKERTREGGKQRWREGGGKEKEKKTYLR